MFWPRFDKRDYVADMPLISSVHQEELVSETLAVADRKWALFGTDYILRS
jgi:hypothetical protein